MYVSRYYACTAAQTLSIPNAESKDQEQVDFVMEKGDVGVHLAKFEKEKHSKGFSDSVGSEGAGSGDHKLCCYCNRAEVSFICLAG
jgi:hypothetical protein